MPPRIGLFLRIVLLEMVQKRIVSQGLKPRRVVCHSVELSGQEEHSCMISVFPLVQAGHAAKIGGRRSGADGSLAEAGDGWHVVAEHIYRRVAHG